MPQYRKGRRSPWQVQIRNFEGMVETFSFVEKRDAQEKENELRHTRQRVHAGLSKPLLKTLFFDFACAWFSERKGIRPDATTRGEDGKLKAVWLPKFGTRLMSSISRSEIEAVLIEIARKNSPATRNRHRALLHVMWEAARIADPPLVSMNPISDIKILPEPKKSSRGDHWQTLGEAERYIAGCYEDGAVYGICAEILVFLGPRVGNALGLKWEDLHWDFNQVVIQRLRESSTGELKERTKGQGEGGKYVAPLFPRLKASLRAWQLKSQFCKPSDLVLTLPDGTPLNYWKYETVHSRVIARLGLKKIGIHGIRHFCASEMERSGFTRAEVKETLGHENIATTEKYTHMDVTHLLSRAKSTGHGKLTKGLQQGARPSKSCQPVVSQHGQEENNSER